MREHFNGEPEVLKDKDAGMGSKFSKILLLISALVIAGIGVWAAIEMGGLAPAYDPAAADYDGAASVIVALNSIYTVAKNVCYSVVFNFRGYDTMGESFILIAALVGSMCILRGHKKGAPKAEEKEDAQDGE